MTAATPTSAPAAPTAAPAAVEAQIAKAFPGWSVAVEVEGDLNGDALPDVVATLKRPEAKDQGDVTPGLAADDLATFDFQKYVEREDRQVEGSCHK